MKGALVGTKPLENPFRRDNAYDSKPKKKVKPKRNNE